MTSVGKQNTGEKKGVAALVKKSNKKEKKEHRRDKREN